MIRRDPGDVPRRDVGMNNPQLLSPAKQRSMIYAELKDLASEAQKRRGVLAAIRAVATSSSSSNDMKMKTESLISSFDEQLLAEFKKLRPQSCWVSVHQPNLPFVTEQRVSIPNTRADGTASQKIRFEIPRVGHLLNDARMQCKMPPVTVKERYIPHSNVQLTAKEIKFVDQSGVTFQDSGAGAYDGTDLCANIVIDLSSESIDEILPGFEVEFDVSNGGNADLFEDDIVSFAMTPDISLARLQLKREVAGVESDVVIVDLSNIAAQDDLSGNIVDPAGTSEDRRYKIVITPNAVDTSFTYDSSAGVGEDVSFANVQEFDSSSSTPGSSKPSGYGVSTVDQGELLHDVSFTYDSSLGVSGDVDASFQHVGDFEVGSRSSGFGAVDEVANIYLSTSKTYDSSLSDISGVTDVSSIPTVANGYGAISGVTDTNYTYTHKKATHAFEETELYSDFEPNMFELYDASGSTADISFQLTLDVVNSSSSHKIYKGKTDVPAGSFQNDEIYVEVDRHIQSGQKDTYDIRMTFVSDTGTSVDSFELYSDAKIRILGTHKEIEYLYKHTRASEAFEDEYSYSDFTPQRFELYDASGQSTNDVSFALTESLENENVFVGDVSFGFKRVHVQIVNDPTQNPETFDVFMTFLDIVSDTRDLNPIETYFDGEAKFKVHGTRKEVLYNFTHTKAINAFSGQHRLSDFVPQLFTLYDASGGATDISFELTKESNYDRYIGYHDVSSSLNERIWAEVVRNPGASSEDPDTYDIFMTFKDNASDQTNNPYDDYNDAMFKVEGTGQVYDTSMQLRNVKFTADRSETSQNYGGYVWGLGHHMIERVDFFCNDKLVQAIPDAGYALHAYEHIARNGRQAKSTFQPEAVTVHELAEMSSKRNTLFVNLGLFFSKGGQGNALPLTKLDRSTRLAVEVVLRNAEDLTWSLPSNSVADEDMNAAPDTLDATFDYKDCEFTMITEHVTLSDYESAFFSNQDVPHLMVARNMIVTEVPFQSNQKLVFDDNNVTSPILSMTFAVDNPQRLVNGTSTSTNPHSIADLSANNVKLFSRRPVQDTSMCDFYEFPRSFPYTDASGAVQYFGVRQYETDPAHAHHSIFLPRNPFDFRHCEFKDSWPGYVQTESLTELDLRIGPGEQRLISDSDRLDIEFFDEYVPSRCTRRMLPNGMYIHSFAEDLGDDTRKSTGVLDFESQGRISIRATTSVPAAQRPTLRVYVDTLEMVKIENGVMRNISIG